MRFIGLFICCTVLLACGSDSPKIALQPDTVILAFGDSLTVGVGATPEESYPSVLSEMLGVTVLNAGISGETTSGGLARFKSVLAQSQPDVLILLEGGNDILRNVSHDEIHRNLASMIQIALGQSIQVVLVSVPQKNLFLSTPDFYQNLVDEYRIVYVDGVLARLLKQPDYKSDPIHLNAAGYRKLAEELVSEAFESP